ncbi:MAG: tetratricopeptide repeat protein [Cyanobacteria bacterium]|nr:tetratricopeptide repeat protein [Cyanobacteriota bacterium]
MSGRDRRDKQVLRIRSEWGSLLFGSIVCLFLLHTPVSAASGKEFLARASTEFAEKKYAAALHDCDRALAVGDSERLPIYHLRGLIFMRMRRHEAAIKDFNESLAIDPHHIPSLYQRSWAFCNLHRLEEAKKDIEVAILVQPKEPLFYSHLSSIYFAMNDHGKCLAAINQSVKLDFYAYRGARGNMLMHCGRSSEALKDIEPEIEALRRKRDPSKLAVLLDRRGICLSRLGRKKEALRDFNESLKLHQRGETAYFQRGMILADSGQDRRAIEDFSHAIDIMPDNFNMYYFRAVSLDRLGRFKQAVDDLEYAIKLKPDHFTLYPTLVDMLIKAGKPRTAALVVQRGLKSCSKEAQPHLHTLLARCLEQEGNPTAALAEVEKAGQVLTDNKDVRTYRKSLLITLANQVDKVFLDKRRVEKILETLRKAPNDIEVSILIARLYRKLARPAEAVAELNKALLSEPDNLTAMELRAKVYFQDLLEFEKAERDLTTMININRRETFYYRERLNVRRAMGRVDDVISDLSRLIELAPASPKELSLRGALLIKQGRLNEGIADLNSSLKIIESSYARGQRGLCNLHLGNYEQAVADLSAAIARNPNPSSYFRARALAYNKQGRFDESEKDVRVILARTSDDSVAHRLHLSNRMRRVQ